jgi:hypothetical protein
VLGATERALQCGVVRHLGDAQRQRDLVALCAAERSLAVPAIGQVGERPGECLRHVEPPRERRCDLAHRGHVRLELAHGPGQAGGHLQRACRMRRRRVRQRAQHAPEPLARRAVHHGHLVLDQVPAEDLRGDVCIGHAAGVEQQAEVVGIADGVLAGAGAARQPDREQRPLQTVLERQPHPEIGRQAERAGDLRGANPSGVERGRTCHDPTLPDDR